MDYKYATILCLESYIGSIDIIRYILEYVKYDKLDDQTIYNAVWKYCMDGQILSVSSCIEKRQIMFVYGPIIGQWNVSNVTQMSRLFAGGFTNFNEDLSGWDVGNVVNMKGMFAGASSFNCDISGWNVGNVVYMREMFFNAHSFSCDISGWNVRNVKSMRGMFEGVDTYVFMHKISHWRINPPTVREQRQILMIHRRKLFG